MNMFRCGTLLVMASVSWLGCSSDTPSVQHANPVGQACTAVGQTAVCTCPDASMALSTCLSTSVYGACACGAAQAGASATGNAGSTAGADASGSAALAGTGAAGIAAAGMARAQRATLRVRAALQARRQGPVPPVAAVSRAKAARGPRQIPQPKAPSPRPQSRTSAQAMRSRCIGLPTWPWAAPSTR
jgi:hypothetical protein